MTNFKKASLLAAFVLTLAYLCGAFIAWDINPGHWALTLRVCMAAAAVHSRL